jgi:hypothetical protein
MADEETKVTIVSWPKGKVALAHSFATEEPCPVSISFTERPARVIVSSDPKQPVAVDMDMKVSARSPIPVCIKLCEPICARSDYTIGINIFDNPFASINLRGLTKFGSCDEQPPAQERICVTFKDIKPGQEFYQAFEYDGLKFVPILESDKTDMLRGATFGEPAGQVKLAFMPPGLRVEFPQPVGDVLLTLNNYSTPDLTISAYAGTDQLTQFVVSVSNTVKDVTIPQTGITSVTVTGGNNEASLVEVCYRPELGKVLDRVIGK